MKQKLATIISTIVISLALILIPNTSLKANSSLNLVSQWNFDEGTGNIAYDTINANDGMLQNMDPATSWVNGKVNTALQFDGVDDYIDCGNDTSLDLGGSPFTVELWVNFQSLNGEQVLIEKYIETFDDDTRSGWGITKTDSNGIRVYGGVGSEPTWANIIPDAFPTMNTGEWYHIAVTRNNDFFTLYWNGIVISSGERLINLDTTSSLKLGRRGDDWGFYFCGKIDEVRIWKGKDITPPTVTDPVVTPNPAPFGTDVYLECKSTDSSGIQMIQYKIDSAVSGIPVDLPEVYNTAYGGTAVVAGCFLPSPATGVYSVFFRSQDMFGNWSEWDSHVYLAVYDPNGGFVTGGGWIMTPEGSLGGEGNYYVVGKATFGFVSKYQHGKTVPSGTTEFRFQAGDLSFKSTFYSWLTISGAKAVYAGEGTINDTGRYYFTVSVIDGDLLGSDATDKFRIRIINSVDGNTVYDNNWNTLISDDPTASVGGGSIMIHKK